MKKNVLDADAVANPNIPLRFWIMIAIALIASAWGGQLSRMVPGGPFISMTTELVPMLAALIAMAIGLSSFRTKDEPTIFLGIIAILISCLTITNVTAAVMEFWVRPAARGAFLGW